MSAEALFMSASSCTCSLTKLHDFSGCKMLDFSGCKMLIQG